MINLKKNKDSKKVSGDKRTNQKEGGKVILSAGFTLFVAMIVSSLLLAVGFSIGNIILKQLLLSGSGKDSQTAFYAADSGIECAEFWDTKDAQGNPLTVDGPFATSTNPAPPACGPSATSTLTKVAGGDTNVDETSTLVVDYSDDVETYKACAIVKIEKGFATTTIDTETVSLPFTKITSRGYNSSYNSSTHNCDFSSNRTVERGLFVQY